MTFEVDGHKIWTSEKVNALPKEFVQFALDNRSINGNYYWDYCNYRAIISRYRLDDIQLIDRPWSWYTNSRVLSLHFVFTTPSNSYSQCTMSYAQYVAECYAHNWLQYYDYYVNLFEGNDVHQKLVELDLLFPFDVSSVVIHH